MARKRLIKGANATRVEERIARVPEDIETGSNIFRALKALEGAQSVSPPPPRQSKPRAGIAPQPRQSKPGAAIAPQPPEALQVAPAATTRAATPKKPKSAPRRKAGTGEKAQVGQANALGPSQSHVDARTEIHAHHTTAENRLPVSTPRAAPASLAIEPPKDKKPPERIGPSDFSAAERAAIVRCCADYRNRLPIYLLAVQKEVEIIDSVIEKCGRADEGKRK
jgi:hypothetical protein